MPLQKGTTPEAISANVRELIHAGHPVEQAAAIAHRVASGQDRASGIVYHCAGSVLLLLRRDGDCDHPLTWAFPGGGIEEGETPEQAAIRESTEETGYTPVDALRLLDWDNGFTTYACELQQPFAPALNGEHLGYVWAPLAALPQPLHPGCALTLGRIALTAAVVQMAAGGMDERMVDGNGWFEVRDNPISKVGIFPYSGRQLGMTGADADRIFQILRPAEELGDPACLESFKLIPWVDDHTMLGPNAVDETPGAVQAEEKGIDGVIGERVYFDGEYIRANLKAFSSTLAALIAAGKRELSAGYRCIYEMIGGEWNGQRYDGVQREIRGNHLATVAEGRMGPDVAVMDKLSFSFDAKEATMADEKTPAKDAEPGATGGAMTLEDATKLVAELAPQFAKLQAAFAQLAGGAQPEAAELDAAPAATPAAPVAGEGGEGTPAGAAADKEPAPVAAGMDEATVVKRIAQRDKLAAQISAHVGAFDHSEMTLGAVIAYGVEKLGIECEKGLEAPALSGWLAGRASSPAHPPATVTGLDAKASADSFVTKHIKGD